MLKGNADTSVPLSDVTCHFVETQFLSMLANFKLSVGLYAMVVEKCSIHQNVCKCLVYNVVKYHKDCVKNFGDIMWF